MTHSAVSDWMKLEVWAIDRTSLWILLDVDTSLRFFGLDVTEDKDTIITSDTLRELVPVLQYTRVHVRSKPGVPMAIMSLAWPSTFEHGTYLVVDKSRACWFQVGHPCTHATVAVHLFMLFILVGICWWILADHLDQLFPLAFSRAESNLTRRFWAACRVRWVLVSAKSLGVIPRLCHCVLLPRMT